LRVLLQHVSSYRYPKPAVLGVHQIRLRPAAHARARVERYGLTVEAGPPGNAYVVWQQDPAGNFVAHARFGEALERLEIAVELAIDIHPVNPFDFVVQPAAETLPFEYGAAAAELTPYRTLEGEAFVHGERFEALVRETAPREREPTVAWLVALNRTVAERVRYVLREEAGVFTPEQTLSEARGSCRDSAVLLVALLRAHGLAARFVSGYLVQLADEGMLPDEPKGVTRDVVDLHAWAEVFLPGAGWIGFDATSGLLTGEGHVPLACTASPRHAAPIDGTSGVLASDVSFTTRVTRLGHEVRPTAPFTEAEWEALVAAGARTDASLRAQGITLTIGGEPTFNSRLHPERPEWNGDALGPTKWSQGLALARAIQARIQPGGAMLLRQGKSYPGESLPRWALELIARRDAQPIWRTLSRERPARELAKDVAHDAQPGVARGRGDAALVPAARALTEEIARRLALSGFVAPVFEDPRWAIETEHELAREIDARHASLDDDEERRRLARLLDRGLAAPAGFVLRVFDAPALDAAAGLHAESAARALCSTDGQAGSGGPREITSRARRPELRTRALESPFVSRQPAAAREPDHLRAAPPVASRTSSAGSSSGRRRRRRASTRRDTTRSTSSRSRSRTRSRARQGQSPPWLADCSSDICSSTSRATRTAPRSASTSSSTGARPTAVRAGRAPRVRDAAAPAHDERAGRARARDRGVLAREPYARPLVRWGHLAPRSLPPADLLVARLRGRARVPRARGLPLPSEVYRAFLELRCPVAGRLEAGDVRSRCATRSSRGTCSARSRAAAGPRATSTRRRAHRGAREGLVPERHRVLVNGSSSLCARPALRRGRRGRALPRVGAARTASTRTSAFTTRCGIDVVDRWARRSLGACAYHVWHPEGRAYDLPPLTRFEATARRAQRFTSEGPLAWPVVPASSPRCTKRAAWTLDLRRFDLDPHAEPERSHTRGKSPS
jgi:transglutaminase-like putative cysteine protease